MRIRSLARRARTTGFVAAGMVALALSAASPTGATLGVNDFPYRGTVGVLDPWGFYTGYCTSFVAWRLNQAGVRFHGASLTGPNGQTRQFGNGGNWDTAAVQVGFTVDTHPAVGAVAVWHGGEGGAWSTGHVAYVMAVDSTGRARVEEYNWSVRYGYDQRVVAAPRYIHFRSAATVAPGAVTTRSQPAATFSRPYRVTITLNHRRGPGTVFASAGLIPAGSTIRVRCQTRSSSVVHGSSIWDRLVDGTYVADFYTTTPRFNAFSPGLPRC